MTARTPEDLLAAAPSVIGFWPEESVVLLTFGADRPFHARLDLPPEPEQTPQVLTSVCDALLAPATRLRVSRAVLLYYSADHRAAVHLHVVLRRAMARHRIGLVAALMTDGTCYQDLLVPPAHRTKVPYDVRDHPFVMEANIAGRLAHQTRPDMVTSLAADPVAVAAVERGLRGQILPDVGVLQSGHGVREAGDWVHTLVLDAVASNERLDDPQLARLVWSMQEVRVRDAAWAAITRRTAAAHVRLWTDVVRRSPERLVAAPAALLAWSCWQTGDGARAWAAVDRCRAAVPDYRLAVYLVSILEQAIPPDAWDDDWDWTLGLPPPAA